MFICNKPITRVLHLTPPVSRTVGNTLVTTCHSRASTYNVATYGWSYGAVTYTHLFITCTAPNVSLTLREATKKNMKKKKFSV